MIRCVACGTSNLESSQYCDECGNLLKMANQTMIEQNPTVLSDSQRFGMGNITSLGIPLVIEEPNFQKISSEIERVEKSPQKINAKLIIERGVSVGTEFQITGEESTIGRWDADNGIFPDIDLDVYDPEAKVSRRHARIIYDTGRFMVEDLGSTNGTFVNRGRRLIPGNPHLLSDNDEIIVGKTFLRFHIN
ncbi:MAG: FHA domain-containing protein [Acidobacteriota bacterium]